MPYDYAVLDNGQGGAGSKKTQQRKYVRSYLKSKGVAPSAAGQRSKREKKLRAEGRAAFAAMTNKKSRSSSSTTKVSTAPKSSGRRDTLRGGEARQAGADASYAKARGAKAFVGRPGEARQAAADMKVKRKANKNYVRGKNR